MCIGYWSSDVCCSCLSLHQSSFCDEGTVGQRLAFVQGVMDYQGVVLPNGDLLYLAASEESARRIQRVVWSLGGFASVSTGQFSLCDESGLVAEQIGRAAGWERVCRDG